MPKYSRRHYEDVAKIMLYNLNQSKAARIKEDKEGQLHRSLVTTMCFVDMFEADNPQFDRDRFLKACGYYF